ncbi:hypothetical protein C4D60_Mb06t06170 [Musa balbisiana]|uniref:Uncharacterized protein n=1 Tax=Musa balbisiana TaxID=52838 RepID=A0A4S8IKY2_MUSBA|nr:hypothetical protein C4D60_Mb06t06170 [Musa balbisiana]
MFEEPSSFPFSRFYPSCFWFRSCKLPPALCFRVLVVQITITFSFPCGVTQDMYLITHFSEFQLATIGSFLIHESVFFLSGFPSIFLERSGLFSKYKIQRRVYYFAEKEQHCRGTQEMCFASNPVPCLCQLTSYAHLLSCVQIHGSDKQSSFAKLDCHRLSNTFLLHPGGLGFCVLLGAQDTAYQMAIQACSQYATPFGLTSEYAHPAEILFLGFATIVGPALTGPHLFTLWLWMVLRVLETVEVHSGYHFPWSPSNFLPLYGGLFGTDKGYRKLKVLEEIEGKDY